MFRRDRSGALVVKNKTPIGEKFTKCDWSAEGVFATEVFDALTVDVKESSGGRLVVLSAAESGGEESDFQLLDLCVEVCAGLGQENGFAGGEVGDEEARGKVGGLDFVAADGDDEALDEVLEFADVARPSVLLEGGKGGIVDMLDWDAVGDAVGLEKMFAQHRDIA